MGMGVKERLIKYLDSQGISKAEFGRTIGVSSAYVTSIRKSIDIDKTKSIALNYPNLNIDWLLYGEGEMLKSAQAAVKDYSNSEGVPYFAVDFIAGFDLVFNNQTAVPDGYISFPHIRGAQAWVDISGKSMSPLIDPGDVIAIKLVEDWQTNILYGEVYALVTEQYRTVKRIRRSERDGWIRLVPENPDYDPQDIPASSIIALYQVLGCAKKIF